MKSEKVKEIKKALEFHRDGLAYLENNCVEVVYCLEKENKSLLEENESLNGSWKNAIKRIAELEKETTAYAKIIQKQDTEISELRTELLGKEKVEKSWNKIHDKQVKEKLKQFAERLKEKCKERYMLLHNHTCFGDIEFEINKTLKEFIDETNE